MTVCVSVCLIRVWGIVGVWVVAVDRFTHITYYIHEYIDIYIYKLYILVYIED